MCLCVHDPVTKDKFIFLVPPQTPADFRCGGSKVFPVAFKSASLDFLSTPLLDINNDYKALSIAQLSEQMRALNALPARYIRSNDTKPLTQIDEPPLVKERIDYIEHGYRHV